MNIFPECLICHQQQTLRVFDLLPGDQGQRERILRDVMHYLAGVDWRTDPLTITRGMYDVINHITGIVDLYQDVKRQSNLEALQVYAELKERIRHSPDPLLTACKLAVAGNIMDFGARAHFDIHRTIEDALHTDFAINAYPRFVREAEHAKNMLLFADNAGELVFDRLLIETLLEYTPIRAVSVVVKQEPIINDATLQDARQVGLAENAQVSFLSIDTRKNSQEQSLWLSPEVFTWIREHDLVISKGQANYEIMSELTGIYFLLIAKCAVIADYIGTHQGAFLLKHAHESNVKVM